ncbi:MAG TPA: glycosyltransferase [Bryobacteraceae bacterium]|nr:glycosyltransferase [Bryobacteraceae bacterium]
MRESSVSVVIPAFRITRYVAEAIDSVLRQTHPASEIIVVNDGCPDGANLEIALRPYLDDGRFRYIRQENRGLAGARNTGIRAAAGDFVAVLDGDDRLRPRALEAWMEMMRASERTGMVYGNGVFFGGTRLDGGELMTNYPSRARVVTFADLVTRKSNSFACAVFRRAHFLEAGLYDESMRKAEDFEMALRVARSGSLLENTREVVYEYRVRPDGLSQSGGDLRAWRIRALEKHRSLPGLTNEEQALVDAELRYQYAEGAVDESRAALREGDYARARENLKAARRGMKSMRLAFVAMGLTAFPAVLRRWVVFRERDGSAGGQ